MTGRWLAGAAALAAALVPIRAAVLTLMLGRDYIDWGDPASVAFTLVIESILYLLPTLLVLLALAATTRWPRYRVAPTVVAAALVLSVSALSILLTLRREYIGVVVAGQAVVAVAVVIGFLQSRTRAAAAPPGPAGPRR